MDKEKKHHENEQEAYHLDRLLQKKKPSLLQKGWKSNKKSLRQAFILAEVFKQKDDLYS